MSTDAGGGCERGWPVFWTDAVQGISKLSWVCEGPWGEVQLEVQFGQYCCEVAGAVGVAGWAWVAVEGVVAVGWAFEAEGRYGLLIEGKDGI